MVLIQLINPPWLSHPKKESWPVISNTPGALCFSYIVLNETTYLQLKEFQPIAT